ncbi:hypothetical protein [Paenibacillus sp. FSL H8-0034]|uniref:hypothetical protein n=1 Tax=Paenibacillus sp. FSL H8-0034 TaxID=2954671 RepID=UPI0030F70C1A
MNRKELLARAAEENIPLTESKLRRYINLGLIVSEVRGRGRARGTSAFYSEHTVDTLKEIQRLSSIKQEALIFTLYWKGYLVSWDKLKEALRSFVATIESKFIDTLQAVSDPHNAENAIEKIAEDSLPSKRPGRPSKEEEEEMRGIYLQRIKLAKGMLAFVADLGKHRMMTVDNMVSFLGINDIAVTTDPHTLFGELVNWTSLDRIFSAIHQAEEQDFVDITEIIETLRWYWNEVESALTGPTANPNFFHLLELVDKHYPGGFVAENTALIQYILLVLLVLQQQFPIKEFLQSEHSKIIFSSICQQLGTVKSDPIEGR